MLKPTSITTQQEGRPQGPALLQPCPHSLAMLIRAPASQWNMPCSGRYYGLHTMRNASKQPSAAPICIGRQTHLRWRGKSVSKPLTSTPKIILPGIKIVWWRSDHTKYRWEEISVTILEAPGVSQHYHSIPNCLFVLSLPVPQEKIDVSIPTSFQSKAFHLSSKIPS